MPHGYEDTFDLFEEPIDFDWDEYLIDDTSPTVLDPEYIEDYEQRSLEIMMARVHEMDAQERLSPYLFTSVVEEIKGEHQRRVQENALSMSRLVEATREFPYIPLWLADAIRSARQAKASVFQAAEILSLVPEMGGIEVMKATYPLDNYTMTSADRHFSAEMMKSFFRQRQAIRLITNVEEQNIKEAETTTYSDTRFMRIYKAKEAEMTLHGIDLELVSRRSYLMLNRLSLGDDQNESRRYPIAMSKYLRLRKPSETQ